MHQRFKIIISYEGTDYCGWQVQPNGVSIQGCLESVITRLSGEEIRVFGSGRTDQGVHARHQVAHFDMLKPMTAKALTRAMNALLPADIRILRTAKVSQDFHARKSAISKEYRYMIWNSEILPPFLRRYRTHIRSKLDADAMREAAEYMVGKHNFRSFCVVRYDGENDFVRELNELTVTRKGSEIIITAKSRGFLYKMVRSMAGYLIKVGKGGVKQPADIKAVLKSNTRTQHVETAPPEGLFLWNVIY